MSELLTAKDVAARLGISEELVKRNTAANNWPCVRFSARTIRYREEHVDQIIALNERKAPKPASGKKASTPVADIFGQTSRSRRASA